MTKHYKNTRQIHAGSIQEIRCIECQWCCQHEVHKVNTEKALEVYYLKGIELMFDPACDSWFAVYRKACKHICADGCAIYDSPDKPEMCDMYMCPYPEETMAKKYSELFADSQRRLKEMFGER